MKKIILLLVLATTAYIVNAQNQYKKTAVIAYDSGDLNTVNAYPVEKLTHIIYSFCHLKNDELHVDNARDSLIIQHLVELKKRNSSLKVILSLGGWGGWGLC